MIARIHRLLQYLQLVVYDGLLPLALERESPPAGLVEHELDVAERSLACGKKIWGKTSEKRRPTHNLCCVSLGRSLFNTESWPCRVVRPPQKDPKVLLALHQPSSRSATLFAWR